MKMKVTVKLSKIGSTIPQLLKTASLPSIDNWGNINGSKFFWGTSHNGSPTWLEFIKAGTGTELGDLANRGAWGMLFIPIEKRYMIYSFGYSNHKLDIKKTELDFGLKVVLNTVNPTKIKSIDSKTHQEIVINRRTQLSQDRGIEDFGFEVNKDFLKQVTGKPNDKAFATLVSGSDGLNIHCELTADTVNRKTTEILNHYKSKVYKTNYAWVDNIIAVKDSDIRERLQAKVIEEFNIFLSGGKSSIDVGCPVVIDNQTTQLYRIKGYRSDARFAYIDKENLYEDLANKNIASVTEDKLLSCKVELGDENEVSEEWRLFDWLIFDVIIDNKQYILSEGEWFEVGKKFFKDLAKEFKNIISNATEFKYIGDTTYKDETEYLDNYPNTTNEIIIDCDNSIVYGGRNRFELCDIYTAQREFIHVKSWTSSQVLSHLFNQGFVSASAFINDLTVRQDLKDKLSSNQILSGTIDDYPKAADFYIVYRILKKGRKFSLPFFSMLVLIEMKKKITKMGFHYRIEWVKQTNK